MPFENLAGKVAVITGGSKGIGAAVARSLADEGLHLALLSRSGENPGIKQAIGLKCDLRDRLQVECAVAEAARRFGKIDILVVNAGVGSYGPFPDLDVDQMEEMVDVNVKGMLYSVRAALPYLIHSGQSDIVTVASEAGRRALPGEAVYVASKFAQVGFTRSLDHELRQHGIRCTSICPGAVATDFGMGRGLRYPGMPELTEMIAADDVAAAVIFALTRPRSQRILELAIRHMSEPSWG